MSLPTLRRRPAVTAVVDVEQAERGAELARLAAQRDLAELEGRIAFERRVREAVREDAERERAVRASARVARRAERARRRTVRAGWLRPLLPLLVVNATAMYGQTAAGYAYLMPGAALVPRLALALLVAAAAEMISLYVQWHAHDALLRGDTRTAGRLRKVSYLIAALIGVVQFTHFAEVWLGVVFALMSASSPWLWGLHSRRAQHIQLVAEGRADTAGAVFSGERIRAFPIRSWRARRWSIDHAITDPIVAWEGWKAERDGRVCGCQDTGLPGVPTAAERARMTAQERNDRARLTCLAAFEAGIPITDELLATAYCLGERWARERLKEARADRTEN